MLDLLCCVGANWLVRKMASASSPELDITQDGNKFHFKQHSLIQTKETAFTVDEEFEETQQNGVVMKVFDIFSWNYERLQLKAETDLHIVEYICWLRAQKANTVKCYMLHRK